jgi:beta-mannosidase
MIRVWGGGVYEHEAFYDACDELGIMVWQDFMFACGVYPAYAEFQETAREEVEQNVKKLRHHPSIAVWCGNNEDYVIPLLTGEEYDAGERDPEKILQSPFPGRLLYERLFPEICKHLTPEIPYTMREFFPPSDSHKVKNFTEDEYAEWHNKSEGAPENLEQYCVDNIHFDNSSLSGYIYGTQLIQSEAVSNAYRSWRRQWSGLGKEYCAGALV